MLLTDELTPDSPLYHTRTRYVGDPPLPYGPRIENELQKFHQLVRSTSQVLRYLIKWKSQGVSYEIIVDTLIRYGGRMYPFYLRDWLVTHFAWAIPDMQAVQFIADLSQEHPISEIGAGNGYWAYRIHEIGGNITTYDSGAWKKYDSLDDGSRPDEETHLGIPIPKQSWFPVIRATAVEVEVPQSNTLFLCWPPIDETMATDCLNRFEGEHLIYIGEPSNGCCANDTFFETLFRNWHLEDEITIPQYNGIHDRLFHYQRCGMCKKERTK